MSTIRAVARQNANESSYDASRFNAVKHGILSKLTVLPWENQDEYDALHAAFVEEHRPVGPTEEHLVEELAAIFWRKRRLRLAEWAIAHRLLESITKSYRATRYRAAHMKILTLPDALYKNALHDCAILEQLADAVDQLATDARHQAGANPRLSTALEDFAAGLCRLFDQRLYLELLRCRAAIQEHEDRMAREALRLAPEFARYVIALRGAFRTGRKNDV